MKVIKYAIYTVLVLLALAVAAGAIFAMTFDPNRYKGDLERIVRERTGRTLKLSGDLAVAVWPSLGARVGGVTLSERGRDEQFLALEGAHASVALLPLLRGEVVVDGVSVSGLKAQVVKDKAGRLNFQDLLGDEKPKPVPGKGKPAESEPVKFDIAGVRIERSSVSYRDLATGQEFALDDLNLKVGRIAERADGKLDLSVRVKGKNPDIDARVQLASDYRFDLPAKSYALSKLEAKLAGAAGAGTMEATLAVPSLVVSAKALAVPQFSAELAVTDPALPMKSVKIPATGSLRADLESETAEADIKAKIDESSLQAKLGLARFSPPAYRFDVNIDQLNLDRYFPPEKAAAAGASGSARPGPAGDTPVDLSALKGLDANGRLQVGALQARGLKMANVKAEVRAANGRAELAPHSADLYGGSVAGAITAQADGNRVTLKEKLANVSIGPILRDFAQQDRLEGRGNLSLDVAAAGATVEAMKKALSGSARVDLKDGAIKGINIAQVLRKAKARLSGEQVEAASQTEKTDFSELSASFAIKNGVARNEDLEVKSPLVRLTGRGDIDIGNSRIDYTTKAAVVATTQGQGGAELAELRGLTVPVQLSGPFDNLSYKVNYGAVAADLAKSRAGEKLKERKEEVKERLGDKLKGLLRR